MTIYLKPQCSIFVFSLGHVWFRQNQGENLNQSLLSLSFTRIPKDCWYSGQRAVLDCVDWSSSVTASFIWWIGHILIISFRKVKVLCGLDNKRQVSLPKLCIRYNSWTMLMIYTTLSAGIKEQNNKITYLSGLVYEQGLVRYRGCI